MVEIVKEAYKVKKSKGRPEKQNIGRKNGADDVRIFKRV